MKLNIPARPINLEILLCGFLAFAFLGGNVVVAQEEGRAGYALEEIVVTATRRTENLQDVALSITALSEDMLEAQGLIQAVDWVRYVPNLSFSEISAGQRQGLNFVIRGVSNTRIFAGGSQSLTTGFQLDDVAIQPVDARLFDVNRIEILKGPQGTLFGQASMGGTIRMFSNQPDTQDFAAKIRSSLSFTDGGDESYTGDVMVNVPVIQDVLGVRGVLSFNHLGGWINRLPASLDIANNPKDPGLSPLRNRSTPSNLEENWNDSESWTARLLAKYRPTDKLTITPIFMHQTRQADAADTYHRNLDKMFGIGMTTELFRETPRQEDFTASSLSIDYNLGFGTLTSITGLTERIFKATQDLTFADAQRVGLNQDGSIPAVNAFDFQVDVEGFSQEVRFNGDFNLDMDLGLGSTSVEYLVGGYYNREESVSTIVWHAPDWNENADNNNFITHPEGVFLDTRGISDYDIFSVFGDVTVRFGSLALTGGARWWDQTQKNGPNTTKGTVVGATFANPDVVAVSTPTEISQDGITPRASVSYNLTEDRLVYLSYSEGFRIGGFQSLALTPACERAIQNAGLPPSVPGALTREVSFKSDDIKNSEIGLKTSWFENRLLVNLSAYNIDWSDLQRLLELQQLDVGCASTITQNVGATDINGFEMEVHAAHRNILAGGTLGYTDAKISEAPLGAAFAVGDTLGGTPEWTASAYLQYGFPVAFENAEGNVRLDWSYRDSIIGPSFVDETDPFVQNDSFYVLNFSATATSGNWGSITLFVNNVTNQVGDHGSSAQFGEPFTNDVATMRPRNAGVRFSKDW